MYAKQHEPPEESSEYEWQLYASQRKVQVRRQSAEQEVRKARETELADFSVPFSMLLSTFEEARVYKGKQS